MIIYLDQYIITSFCMNFLLVQITQNIIRSHLPKVKSITFSLIVTAVSLSIFIPYISQPLHIMINITITGLLLIFTFKPNNLISFMRIVIVYCTTTFSIGGCALMIINLYGQNNVTTILIPTAIITYFTLGLISDIYEKYYITDKMSHCITIVFNKNSLKIKGYLDTGNSLTDPISKLPVIIIGLDTIKSILPADFVHKMRNKESINEIYPLFANQLKLKFIPYHTINGEGVMLGFVPETIRIDNKATRCIIAISPKTAFAVDKNTAILHPQLII